MCTDTMRRRCLAPAVHLAVCLFVLAAASCAKRVPPAALPAALAHPEFVYPALPAALEAAPGASRIDVGWRYLQAGDLTNAGLEFGVALKLGPRLYPARAGQGYVAMAMRDYDRALTAFGMPIVFSNCTAARLLDVRSAVRSVIDEAVECSSSGTQSPWSVGVGSLSRVMRLEGE